MKLGPLAHVHEDCTVLEMGARGSFGGAAFALVGRACMRGHRGSLWNEWTMRFDDGRTLFLTEAFGALVLYEEGSILPAWDALAAGEAVDPGHVVVERGTAHRVASWGEVAEAPESHRYVALSARSGAPATIDYGGERPRVFLGRRLSLAEVGLTTRAGMGHPRCIPTPDVSRPLGVDVWLAPGDEGELDGEPVRVVGIVSRTLEGERTRPTSWEEYLLYGAARGLRWLVVSGGHWSLARNVEAGLVRETEEAAEIGADRYEAEAEQRVRVVWAAGELPWEVAVGDASSVRDYTGLGDVLTKEWTLDEVSWSLTEDLTPDVIAKAFRKRTLPKPMP
jgi:hypothetical protein